MNRTVALLALCSLLPSRALTAQDAPSRSAPFDAVKWEGDVPSVRVGGQWYEFVSIDGFTGGKIVELCKKEYGSRWKTRFGEDLCDALGKLGHTPKAKVALVLKKDGATVEKSVEMTEYNRDAIRDLRRNGPPDPAADAPERSAPFSAVRWVEDKPVVRVDGEWYDFVSIDGVTREKLVAFCKKEHEEDWKKEFGEEMTENLAKMGHKTKVGVKLVLERDGKTVQKTALMTEPKRRSVWQLNQAAGDALEDATARRPSAGRRAARPAVRRDPGKRFEFESAKIVFTWTGAFEGTDTFYAAGHGTTMVLDSDKTIAGRPNRLTFVWKDGKCTQIRHLERRAFTTRVKPAAMDHLSVIDARESQMKRIGLLRKGTENVMGKPCVLYEKLDGDKVWRSWRWKGIELKIEMKNYFNASYVKEATLVEEGAAIPEALLKVPEGFSYKDFTSK